MKAFAIALALAAPMILLGCSKKDGPTEPPTPQPFVYPDQSTPKNAVLRMSLAFERRDSVVTDSVYASDYEGTSSDMRGPSPEILTFTKADEVRAVGAMALSHSITSTRMNLGSTSTWFQTQYGPDPPGWTTIQIPFFSIYVNDVVLGEYQTQSTVSGEVVIFEFTLKPTTPDPASPTDTTWTVVRWVESRSFN